MSRGKHWATLDLGLRGVFDVAKNIADFALAEDLCVVATGGLAYCPSTGKILGKGVGSIEGSRTLYCMVNDDRFVLCTGGTREEGWVDAKKWLHVSGSCFLSEDKVKQCMSLAQMERTA